MTWETVLVDGEDISALGARVIRVWDGAHTDAPEVGDALDIPGRDGVQEVARTFDATVLTLGLKLRADVLLTGYNDLKRALVMLCKPGQQITLTRRLSFSTGNEEHTAPGRYLSGLTPTLATPAIGMHTLSFMVLSGVWFGTQVSTTPSPTRLIAGEVPPRRITLTLPGSGTLENNTTGASVTVTGAHTLDVENHTTNGALANVTASGDPLGAWFNLRPGVNDLSWSGSGTPTIAYYPAYK